MLPHSGGNFQSRPGFAALRNPLDGYAPRQARILLVALTIAYVLSFIDRQILNLLVEPLKRDLGITDVQVSLLQGASFAIIYAMAGLPLAWVADHHSRRRLIVAGIAVWSAMTAWCGLVRTYPLLALGRAGVGIGEAALSPAAYSMLTDAFVPRKLPRAMALYNLGPAIGSGLAYMLGGAIVAAVARIPPVRLGGLGAFRPWQLAFILVGALGLVVMIVALAIREPPRRTGEMEQQGRANLLNCVAFLRRHRTSVGRMCVGMALLSIVNYASMAWYPTMFLRDLARPLGEVGMIFGAMYVAATISGNLVGAWGAMRCAERGLRVPYLWWMALSSMLVAISSGLTPLLPGLWLRYAGIFLALLTQNLWMGAGVATLHLASPSRLRAQLTAILLLGTNVVGGLVGPSAVAALTQYALRDPRSVNVALAFVGAIAGAAGAVTLSTSLRSFDWNQPAR